MMEETIKHLHAVQTAQGQWNASSGQQTAAAEPCSGVAAHDAAARGRSPSYATTAEPGTLLQRFRAYSWNRTREDSEEISSSKRRRQRSRQTHVVQCADAIMTNADESGSGAGASSAHGDRMLLQVEDGPVPK